MKDVVINELKENEGKVFTKKIGNDIIKKDYNPFEVNLIYKRRDGLCMKEIEIGEINENLDLKEFIYGRIEKNASLFSDSEMTIINNNRSLMEKIYLIGILDNVKN